MKVLLISTFTIIVFTGTGITALYLYLKDLFDNE